VIGAELALLESIAELRVYREKGQTWIVQHGDDPRERPSPTYLTAALAGAGLIASERGLLVPTALGRATLARHADQESMR